MSEQITKIGNILVGGNNTESKNDSDQVIKTRPRKPTLLKLQWLAERVRKCEAIKKQLADGTYHVDSHDIARAMLNLDKE